MCCMRAGPIEQGVRPGTWRWMTIRGTRSKQRRMRRKLRSSVLCGSAVPPVHSLYPIPYIKVYMDDQSVSDTENRFKGGGGVRVCTGNLVAYTLTGTTPIHFTLDEHTTHACTTHHKKTNVLQNCLGSPLSSP
eukprot:50161-Eustigmatos_ZCMA.PRE.1